MKRQAYILDNIEVVQAVDGFTPCWEWQASLNDLGYGQSVGGGKDGSHGKAYRASYMAFVGPVPNRLHLDHLCSNHPCVNPEHLEPVTQRENVQRAVAHHKANGTGNWTRLDVCAKGLHAMTGDNVSITHSGGRPHRNCVTCVNDRNRQYRANNPERMAKYAARRKAIYLAKKLAA
jgi:hypothetical protein